MNRSAIAKFYVALALAGVPAARADVVPPTSPQARATAPIVGFVDAAKPACWARDYDAAHMAAHKKQKVTAIAFTYVPYKTFPSEAEPIPMWDQGDEMLAFSAILAAKVKGHQKTMLASVHCTASGNPKTLNCGVDADGGSFTLTLKDDGKVRLDLPAAITVGDGEEEGDSAGKDWTWIDPKDDQEAFLLSTAKGNLCDADYPVSP